MLATNSRRGLGLAPLHLATIIGSVDDLQEMLKSSPDINVQDFDRRTPLHYAVEIQRLDIVEVLLKAGARCDIFDSWGFSPLVAAAAFRYYDVLKVLITFKPDLDVQNDQGMTALHSAASFGNLKIVELLLDSGARFDIVDREGRTFMFNLVVHSLVRVIPRDFQDISLLEKIVDQTTEMEIIHQGTGETASHIICKRIHHALLNPPVINIILSKQKDINATNHAGETPLNLLLEHSESLRADVHIELIQLLVKRGAYITKEDCEAILRNDTLRNGLFRDIEFCAEIIMHEFIHKLLPKFYSLLNPMTKIPLMEVMKMTLLPQVSRVIRNDIKSEIGRKGYCDVSSIITTSLSKRCIEVYVSYQLQEISLRNKWSCSEEESSSINREHKRQRLNESSV